VLACQLPPDSHCATASQLGAAGGAALDTAVEEVSDAATNPPATKDLTRGLQSLLMSNNSAGVSEALPIRKLAEIAHLSAKIGCQAVETKTLEIGES
jgi:hypothetical protein